MMREEQGVTMIEVLVSMSITAIIGVVLAGTIVTGARTTDQTRVRLSETQEQQLTTAHFVADVQSASTVATSSSCGTGTLLVALSWSEAGVAKAVAYRTRTAGGTLRLSRSLCTNAGAATVIDLARELGPGTPVTVTCSPTPCGASTRRVTLAVTGASGASFTATGVRRVT